MATEAGKSQAADGVLDGHEDEAPPVQAKLDEPDFKAELAKLREERAADKAQAEEREKQLLNRLDAAEKRAMTPPAAEGQPRRRRPEEWEQLFNEKGFVGALGAYETDVLNPFMQGIRQEWRAEVTETLQIVANNQREHLKRDPSYTDARIKKVDALLSSLPLKDRAQPGVYSEALSQIVEAEELADLRMNGGRARQTVRSERGPEVDDFGGEPSAEPSRAELRHMKMFGIKDKKEFETLRNAEIPV